MNILRANSGHLDALAGLFDQYRCFYEQASDPKACRQFIADRLRNKESVIFAAQTDDGDIAGFTQLYRSFCSVEMKELIYLYDLFVLQLETAISNRPGQALYEDLGWERDREFYTYHLALQDV
jgi:hypothetical protein